MNSKNFTHLNEDFICEYCGQPIKALTTGGCRNHCPHCLSSKHVDIMPGDRKNPCHGQLKAIGYETHPKKGLILIFKCEKCGEIKRNKSAVDGTLQPDDYDLILSLTPEG